VIASSERQLGDEKFINRAPTHVVESIREKLSGYREQLQKLRESL
jgi:valyl-tRNA synthetase